MQAGSIPWNQRFSCKWNLSFFKAVPPNGLPFYLGSLLHIIRSLSSHFSSWDCPENFGIYSQIDRKRKTFFFHFPQCVCLLNRTGQILISQLSPPKFRYFAHQNGRTKVDPMKINFDNFQIQKWISQRELKK